MIIVLDKSDKDKIKEMVKEDEVALNIVDNINEKIGKVAKKCSRLIGWGNTLSFLLFLSGFISMCLNFDNISGPMIVFGGIATFLISWCWFDILEGNAYKLTITEKELEYLNLLLKKRGIEKKYSVIRKSDGKIWYYKDENLLNAECDDKRQISNVVYLEYYEINKYFPNEYSLDKKESFQHFEPALYNKCY